MVITFKAEAINTPTAIDGQCGSVVNQCLKGTFVDLTDTATQYKWRCRGLNGGSDVQCSKNRPITVGTLNTKSATNISKNSALLRGEVVDGRKIDT